MDTKSRFDGIARLYGEKGATQLAKSHILIVGLGGVGSWAVEAIARAGVGKITIVDMDEICVSNTNRQLHALTPHFGKLKAEVLKDRILAINPDCEVNAIIDFFTRSTMEEIFNQKYDYVIDCIDSMTNKCLLVAECVERGIPVITTGGAGGKFDATKIQIADLNKSYNDKMLMLMRKNLKRFHNFHQNKKKPYGVPCVFSPEDRNLPEQSCEATNLNCDTGFGAITHITGLFGFMAAGHVINAIVNNNIEVPSE